MGLALIALIPSLGSKLTEITTLQGIGSTSLIIMVGVALDIINQIKTHLLTRQYEGFLKQ
jgi:preprotein translocase subunit SecY